MGDDNNLLFNSGENQEDEGNQVFASTSTASKRAKMEGVPAGLGFFSSFSAQPDFINGE
jgi:hypothetical protein